MRLYPTIAVVVLLTIIVAGDSGLAQDVKVYLKDGQIIRERRTEPASDAMASQEGKGYHLKKWDIATEVDPVQEALKVYKKKGEPLYQKRVWIIDKGNGTKNLLVEYVSSSSDSQVVFSPEEDFMYFLRTDDTGQNLIYGLELNTRRQFHIGTGKNFNLLTCPNRMSYVILEQDEQGLKHFIYQLTGEQKRVLHGAMTQDEIKKQVCY
jgi:hypothetical protein